MTDKKKEKEPLTKEQIQKILELLQEAATKAGNPIKSAVLIDSIDDETGEVTGDILLDNRKPEDMN